MGLVNNGTNVVVVRTLFHTLNVFHCLVGCNNILLKLSWYVSSEKIASD